MSEVTREYNAPIRLVNLAENPETDKPDIFISGIDLVNWLKKFEKDLKVDGLEQRKDIKDIQLSISIIRESIEDLI